MPHAILDPTGLGESAAAPGLTLAPRPANLTGARVTLLENGKQNARLFLEDVGALLRERHGIAEVHLRKKANFAVAEGEDVVDAIRAEADAVVLGVGDCGSCSAAAIADGVNFERHGTPAAVICSEAFVATADAMADVNDAPGYHYVTTPHPVAGLSPEQVAQRAETVADQIAAMLEEHSAAQAA
jgi:hypothetical protein